MSTQLRLIDKSVCSIRCYRQIVRSALVVCVLLPGLTQPAAGFERRFYGGISAGATMLTPDEAGTGFELVDEQGSGFDVRLGWDFLPRWSLEANFASLGSAALRQGPGLNLSPPEGEIDYTAAAISAIAYFYNNQGAEGLLARRGLSLFAGLGAAQLDTESELPFRQIEDVQVLLTAGAELGYSNGIAGRLQVTAYDADAISLNLGLVYRFGHSGVPQVTSLESVTPPVVVETGSADSESENVAVVTEGVALDTASLVVPAPSDSDADGVANTNDRCPQTERGRPVDSSGCSVFDGRLVGLVFDSGSAQFGGSGRAILDELAAQLLLYPETRIAVMAHTDNSGNARENLELSKQRALSVANYLTNRGVSTNRIQPEAYGESQPISDNSTVNGRASNRRIELRTLP